MQHTKYLCNAYHYVLECIFCWDTSSVIAMLPVYGPLSVMVLCISINSLSCSKHNLQPRSSAKAFSIYHGQLGKPGRFIAVSSTISKANPLTHVCCHVKSVDNCCVMCFDTVNARQCFLVWNGISLGMDKLFHPTLVIDVVTYQCWD